MEGLLGSLPLLLLLLACPLMMFLCARQMNRPHQQVGSVRRDDPEPDGQTGLAEPIVARLAVLEQRQEALRKELALVDQELRTLQRRAVETQSSIEGTGLKERKVGG